MLIRTTRKLSVQVVNLVANKVARVIGMSESNERFLSLALFQGRARPDVVKAARLGDASRAVCLLSGCVPSICSRDLATAGQSA